MMIGGLQKFTLLDYPGKIAAIVFTKGCNLRCPYCHNPEIVDPKMIDYENKISDIDIFEFLEGRKGDLDGVCITGGEPTLQVGLENFIRKIKEMGFLVKLDTNATKFAAVKNLLEKDIVDYWAIDIKTTPEKYKMLRASEKDVENIQNSIDMIVKKRGKLELRTTAARGVFNDCDIDGIVKWLNSVNKDILRKIERYSIQGFRPEKTLRADFNSVVPYSKEVLEKIADGIRPYCKNVAILNE